MDLMESFPENITKWEVLRDIVDLDIRDDVRNVSSKSGSRIRLLPRKTMSIYGNLPKMEQRVYSKCKECRLIFNPRNILYHKACAGKSHTCPLLTFDLKAKLKSKSSAKSQSNTPSPPPFRKPPSPTIPVAPTGIADLSKMVSTKSSKGSNSSTISTSTTSSSSSSHKSSSKSSHTSKSSSPHATKSPKLEHSSHSTHKSSRSSNNSAEQSDSSKSNSSNSHSRSSKHRKSRKSGGSKNSEEFNPKIHCGVTEDNKSPCMRSLNCSSHRLHSKKTSSSRAKDIRPLDWKKSKDRDSKHSNNMKGHTSPNELGTRDPIESYDPTVTKTNTPSVMLPRTITEISSSSNCNISVEQEVLDIGDFDLNFPTTMEMENEAETVPIVYMPISPVSIVNPVEYVKIGKNIIRLESPQSATSPPVTKDSSVIVTIPNNMNVKMYKSHPKPVTMPAYGAKKVGGAIVLSKHQLDLQRNNLLRAINANSYSINNIENYKTLLNSSNVLHKNSSSKSKSNGKSNSYKRNNSDKLLAMESKQAKYSPNLNGFVLHSTISEAAEVPLSNIVLNDKKVYRNIK